jgi:glycogen operon protein
LDGASSSSLPPDAGSGAGGGGGGAIGPNVLGARYDAAGTSIHFGVYSARATRIELEIFAAAFGEPARLRVALEPQGTHIFGATVTVEDLDAAGVGATVHYGYRAWGPNWPHDASWTPGSEAGFGSDVDADGNRFDPNKLLIDPYARELSHDPVHEGHLDGDVYRTGAADRLVDTGPIAPKAIVLPTIDVDLGDRPSRPFRDEIVYEVHPRGLTRSDPTVPAECRGTYAGVGAKAAYLASIGVSAIELLPVHETANDQNDLEVGAEGDNYWGYSTLSFFAPDRRYACDRSAGGPTREFREMVAALHGQGIKVYLDVVYNHTAEGGVGDPDVARLYSMRGLDNATYYELTSDGAGYVDNTGTGANINAANGAVRNLVLDSLTYWTTEMGVDGFRFDLAAVLANRCDRDCFEFDVRDPEGILPRAAAELPRRPDEGGPGVDLIAEPWAIGPSTYRIGEFPSGYAEWNGKYRDLLRKHQNHAATEAVTPGWLADRLAGSPELFGDDGRRPWHSLNYIACHDGFTLRDVYGCNVKDNDQPWPYGPSNGGDDANWSSDQGGDPARQRQATRTGLALAMVSAGVPMITGGDELYRTQYCNNNPYNLDSDKNWLDWGNLETHGSMHRFARNLMRFRAAHPALRPAAWLAGVDQDGNGLKDVAWLRADGVEADGVYLDDAGERFLAFRLDGAELGDGAASIYVAYNGEDTPVAAVLPALGPGTSWYRVVDTGAWMEFDDNSYEAGAEPQMPETAYVVPERAVLVLVER